VKSFSLMALMEFGTKEKTRCRDFFPAVPVDKVVDTTGCGDAFRAGLMFSLFSGATTVEAILVGLKFGALKAQTRGSHCKGLCESQTDG
jgi:sugar/nucleoside kinase (ribokinase family)